MTDPLVQGGDVVFGASDKPAASSGETPVPPSVDAGKKSIPLSGIGRVRESLTNLLQEYDFGTWAQLEPLDKQGFLDALFGINLSSTSIRFKRDPTVNAGFNTGIILTLGTTISGQVLRDAITRKYGAYILKTDLIPPIDDVVSLDHLPEVLRVDLDPLTKFRTGNYSIHTGDSILQNPYLFVLNLEPGHRGLALDLFSYLDQQKHFARLDPTKRARLEDLRVATCDLTLKTYADFAEQRGITEVKKYVAILQQLPRYA